MVVTRVQARPRQPTRARLLTLPTPPQPPPFSAQVAARQKSEGRGEKATGKGESGIERRGDEAVVLRDANGLVRERRVGAERPAESGFEQRTGSNTDPAHADHDAEDEGRQEIDCERSERQRRP